jgi:hypothetical protein
VSEIEVNAYVFIMEIVFLFSSVPSIVMINKLRLQKSVLYICHFTSIAYYRMHFSTHERLVKATCISNS